MAPAPRRQPPSLLTSFSALFVIFVVLVRVDSALHGTPVLTRERVLCVAIAAATLLVLMVRSVVKQRRARIEAATPFEAPAQRLHDLYAHRALPKVLLGATDVTLKLLAGDADLNDPHGPVQSIWRGLADELGARDAGVPTARRATVGSGSALLVTLPPEEGPTLAHFVVAVPTAEAIRYFTLERDASDPAGATVLGEWSAQGHTHHGPGPAPTETEFLAAVAKLAVEPEPLEEPPAVRSGGEPGSSPARIPSP